MSKDLEMQAAMLKTISKAPYLATALWNVRRIKSDKIPTMGVDKFWRLYYNPEVFKVWSMDEVVSVLMHEVWHLLRDHPKRAEIMGIDYKDRSADTQIKATVWNIAADCEINDGLIHEGHKLPEKFLAPDGSIVDGKCQTPDLYGFDEGLLTEEYYDMLLKNMPPIEKIEVFMTGAGGGMSGSNNSPADGELEESEGQEGGGAQGGVSAGEAELIRQATAENIAKNIGTAPGFAERWADKYLNPTVDWRKELAGAIRGAMAHASGMVDYTYNRPSRRQSVFPKIVLPTLRGPRPDVGIAIDTSGSMFGDDLNACLGEVKGILDAAQSSVKVLSVDTQVHSTQDIYTPEEITLVGGGGTDMVAALEALGELGTAISIVLTDGYTPWCDEKPNGLAKTIVCLINAGRWGTPDDPPEWIDSVIQVNPEE